MRFQSALQLLAVSQLSSWVPLAAAEEDHVILQRSLEMGTWAGQTRGLLDDFSTCNGCQVSSLCVIRFRTIQQKKPQD